MSTEDLVFNPQDRAAIIGATGFVGRRLISELAGRQTKLRLFVRNIQKAARLIPEGSDSELAEGDLLDRESLQQSLKGIHTAYYLAHSMGGTSIFSNKEYAEKDEKAATNFISAANEQGLKRIIYLGALGEGGDQLSEHLKSRAEIADILSSGSPAATVLRAAIIVGAGGASYEMLRYLVERLPVMVCPKWIDTRIQPIALRDILAYLSGCLLSPETSGKSFDVGGPEILTYREMMQQYAEARGIANRIIFRVPFLTPLLSAYWVDLVTPIPSGVAHPLIEGMKNEVICREYSIESFIKIAKTPFKEAVRIAVSEEIDGPGVTGW
ncbi:MAG: NADH-binding protein [Thermodesulfovibrio sp.]|nr:NADH-binding protein [Thermodesulfovibrio sp.]